MVNQSLCVLLGTHYLRDVVSVREAEATVESNLGNTSLTALGLYHYNTIGTAGTIDSGRRSILQYLNALDIFRADTLKTSLANDTIYYVERVVALVY